MIKTLKPWLVALLIPFLVFSQTQLDLGRQSKNMDFRGFPFTRPFKTVTVLPSTCTIGDVYDKTNNTAGQNLYLCTSTNVLTQLSSAGPTGATGATGANGAAGTTGTNGSTGVNGNTGVTGPTGTAIVTGTAGNLPKYNSGGTGLTDSLAGIFGTVSAPNDKFPLFDTGSFSADACVFLNGSSKLTTNGPSFNTCLFGPAGQPGKIVIFDPTAGGATNQTADSGKSFVGTGPGVHTFTGSKTTGHTVVFNAAGDLIDGGAGSAGPTGATGANGATGPAGSGAGDVLGPATNTDGLVPQWNGNNSKTLKNGLAVVTTVGSPGLDTNIATEKAIRSAISSGPNGPTGPTGAAGANGTTGVAGATGAVGSTGAAGATGTNGSTGAVGATGTAGSNGSTGAAGVNGSTGPTGAAGAAVGSLGDAYAVSTAGQTTFTPGWTFGSSLLLVFLDGVKQRPGGIYDYQVSGNTVVFNTGLVAGQTVEVIQ